MGLLSLLCCGAEASNDSDDKYHNQSPTPSRSAPQKAANLNPKGKNTDQDSGSKPLMGEHRANGGSGHVTHGSAEDAAVAKAALDDDNSVNESDTLTAQNEEPKLDLAKNEHAVKANDQSGAKVPEKRSETVQNGAQNGAQNGTQKGPINPADVITSVNETGNSSENDNGLSSNHEDVAGDAPAFDLSAIQENQSFNPETGCLLGKKDLKRFGNKKCLVLDLDETLVHSSFKYLRTADFVIPVEIEDQVHHVYVIKRPGVDEFLRRVGKLYEVVVFTASVAKYGDPLLNKLDIHKAVHQRLFRDSCYTYQGNFIKNLSQLGRPLEDSIIIDNSPASYVFHPQHSVPISSWFSDTHDNELLDLLPLLEDLSKPNVDNVGLVLDMSM